MKIPFQAWLQEQPIDSDSLSLLNEALLCYQISAYRAALVFSYLGFSRILATRLMTAVPPANFPANLWQTIQRKIRDDATWEPEIFDAVLRAQPIPVFLIDDDLRQQIQYWRSRRNDAAHSKGNEISHAHVEMLWLFIRSNLAKFVVNGGPAGLLERFRRHFDPTFTPPDSDFFDLVRQIPESVPALEYGEFFRHLFDISESFQFHYGPELWGEAEALVGYLERLADSRVLEAFAAEIRQSQDLLLSILFFKPAFVVNFGSDNLFIHDLWHDLLPLTKVGHVQSIHGSLRVVSVMLRTELIPGGVREAAVHRIVERIEEDTSFRERYPQDLLDELAPFGFWEAVRHHAFEKYEHIDWMSRNLSLATEYLERHPVDSPVATSFCALFPQEIPDVDDYSWLAATKLAEPEDLLDLNFYFHSHPKLFREIVREAKEHGIECQFFQEYMNPKNLGPTTTGAQPGSLSGRKPRKRGSAA